MPGAFDGSSLCTVTGVFRHTGDGPVHPWATGDKASWANVAWDALEQRLVVMKEQKAKSDESLNEICIMQTGQTQKLVFAEQFGRHP